MISDIYVVECFTIFGKIFRYIPSAYALSTITFNCLQNLLNNTVSVVMSGMEKFEKENHNIYDNHYKSLIYLLFLSIYGTLIFFFEKIKNTFISISISVSTVIAYNLYEKK